MDCLDANTIQELMAGSLDATTRAAVTVHLDTCLECSALVAAMGRDAVADAALAHDPALAATAISLGGPIADDAAPLPAGTRIGRFVLRERLGAGGMGVVYLADDPELGREVAVKLVRRTDERAATQRLLREARAMAQVGHPNVVAIWEVGVAADQVYIAMERIVGETLGAWQRARQRTTEAVVAAYVGAGRGLAAAHAAGVVHRDFKPDNVLIDREGRARVTDFGLAGNDAELATSGVVAGTPAYMAPEQFRGGHVDARTDQFNFCVALHEALYGARPFAGASFAALSEAVCAGRLAPPPAGVRVSSALRRIVLRGLSARPGDRWPTMAHLLAELGRDRARPWRVGALACAVAALVVGVGLAADWTVRARTLASTHASFRATGDQLERALALRYDAFAGLAGVAYLTPVMREVTSYRDQADFGLGTPEADDEARGTLHDTLASADWVAWAQRERPGVIAVADYKGRLLYTSAAPTQWGGDLLALPSAARALRGGRGDGASLVRDDDPRITASHLLGATPPDGLELVFARALAIGGVAGGLFVQGIDAAQLLTDVSLGDGTLLALVAPDGAAAGTVPGELVAAAPRTGGIVEIDRGGTRYLVQTRLLPGVGGDQPIARVVLARVIDPGLGGLFPDARLVLALAALALVGAAAGGWWRAGRIARAPLGYRAPP